MNVARIRIWFGVAAAAFGFFVAVGTARAADSAEDLAKDVQQLSSITGDDQITAKVREWMKEPEKTDKRLKTAEEILNKDPEKITYNAAVILARVSAGRKNYDLGLRFYKLCFDKAKKLKSPNKLAEAFEGQYILLAITKKFDQAEKLCRDFLELDSEDEKLNNMKVFVLERLSQVMARQGKVKEALKIADELTKESQDSWYFLKNKALILHEAGKFEESATAYQEAIDKLQKFVGKLEELDKKSDEIQKQIQDLNKDANDLHYILSNVYVDLNQVDKAVEQLKIVLKSKPDNPTYNNDLGYIWADHDMNLDEAEKLIRKALDEDRKQRKKDADLTNDEDKDKAAYLDSLAWVLYKKKKYDEAKKIQLEVVKDAEEGNNIEILDHLADIHMAMGEKKEAIAVWKKCLEADANTKREMKRQEEVKAKLKAAEGK